MIKDIAKLITRLLILRAIQQSVGFFFGTGGSGTGVTITPEMVGFAKGGITGPGMLLTGGRAIPVGERGPEAVMPLKRTTNGELGIAADGQASQVAVEVVVNNNTGSDVKVEQRRTDSGVEIDLLLENKVESMISSGRLDTILNATYGLNRRGFA